MLTILRSQYARMLEHVRRGLPNEACGLLAGETAGEDAAVGRVFLLGNADRSPEHFSMLPAEQFAAVREMRRGGLRLLGNFHSHPQTPARMSQEDRRLAFDKSLRYLIFSLAEETPVLRCFRIDAAGAVTEEPISYREG